MAFYRHVTIIVFLVLIVNCHSSFIPSCPYGCLCNWKSGSTKCDLNAIGEFTFACSPLWSSLQLEFGRYSVDGIKKNQRCFNVTRLILNGNLTNLKKSDFQFVPNLRDLKVKRSTLTNIPNYSFYGLASLRVVRLIDNPYLNSISPNWLTGVRYLKSVVISRAKLSDMSGLFATNFKSTLLKELQEIDISQTNIKFIPENAFTIAPNLIKLHLANNKIQHIYPNSFSLLSKLKILNLDSNNLLKFPALNIHNLVSLQHLYLSKNKMQFFILNRCRSSLYSIYLNEMDSMNYLPIINWSSCRSLRSLSLRQSFPCISEGSFPSQIQIDIDLQCPTVSTQASFPTSSPNYYLAQDIVGMSSVQIAWIVILSSLTALIITLIFIVICYIYAESKKQNVKMNKFKETWKN